MCVVDHGVNEGEPIDEQYRDQVCEDQFHDPKLEGQYLDQDFSEGFENDKFNPIVWCIFCPSFINTTYVTSRLPEAGPAYIWLLSRT